MLFRARTVSYPPVQVVKLKKPSAKFIMFISTPYSVWMAKVKRQALTAADIF